ncbi:DUF2298 domain-containing protein [Chloroflexota bacterium]
MDEPIEEKRSGRRNLIIVGLLLTGIILGAAFLRFRGLLWGEYQYLHPDERFLVWVGTDISPVDSLGEYWDTANSSLNPHNRGHGFYVYGTLPMYLARYFVEWIYGHSGFNEMTNVGRFLSAFADLLSVLLVFLIGEKAYNRRVGLLAAAFSALAVLQIQQAHFFTVDTFTTLFVMLAIYFAVRVAYDKRPVLEGAIPGNPDIIGENDESRIGARSYWINSLTSFFRNPLFSLSLGFGIALGLAASSKVSAAPVAILLPAAMLIRITSLRGDNRRIFAQEAFVYLILAGFVSLFIFRVFQPMAFSGPGFFGIEPNPAWMANLRELRNQAGGDVDFPPALQWARRPVWFAWQNIVLWGMGLPMGLLAWAGFLWIGWRMIKGDWRKHILLWGWAAIIFTWQSLIFNPSMRYQLLIYPILAIFAAWVVFRIYDWGKKESRNPTVAPDNNNEVGTLSGEINTKSNKWARSLAIVIGSGVLIATAVYAFSFSNIYTRPITRVGASRWIYQNIPGPINLPIKTLEGDFNQIISYPYNHIISPDFPFVSGFTAKQSGELTNIRLGGVIDPRANFGEKDFRVKISEIPGGGAETVTLSAVLSPGEPGSIISSLASLNRPLEVEDSQQYYINLSLPPGQGPVILNGSLEVAIQGEQVYTESIPLTDALVDSTSPYLADFSAPGDGVLTDVLMTINSPEVPVEKSILLAIFGGEESREQLAVTRLSGTFESGVEADGYDLPLNNPVSLEQGKEYTLHVSLETPEGEIILQGTPIANEGAWDDGLPVRLDGYDGFAGIFEPGLNFDMYEDDNPNKLSRFYDILDHTQYILISSSRQWANLPRIPERFPMTSEYYRHLLGCPPEKSIEWCYNFAQVGSSNGDLGFDLVQVFQSNPALNGFVVNDQPSEEAFTVYDHPKVLIFQKNADYDPENVRDLLGSVDLTKVEHITPKKAGTLPKDMMLPSDRLFSQLEGGTWSQLFNIDAWLNRWPILGVIGWYLVVAVLGFITYPLLRLALPGLADRGYPLARTAGMLFLSYFVWLAGTLNIPFTRPTITVVILLLLGLSGIIIYIQRADLRKEWGERKTYFLVIEGLFLAFFVVELLIRLGNPDLWHPWKGGEKPMDFSYLNAVLKSTTFPPFDPWFSGGYINYYYYGFVLVGVLIKWLGIIPSVAYNLIIPTLFSLIAMGAFSLGWNLISAGRSVFNLRGSLFKSIPFFTGLAASMGLALLGNLGIVRMIFQGYQRLAAPGGNIEGANIIMRIIWAVKGALLTLTGSSLPYGIADWYWLPSRVIPAPNDVEPITEFPFFTVLYGDPHAHLFALPLTLLALTWALSIIFSKGWRQVPGDTKLSSPLLITASLLVGGLAIGALRPTNTWDFPIYLALGLIAISYAVWKYHQPATLSNGLSPRIKRIMLATGAVLLLGLLAFLLFQPYAKWYVQGYTDIAVWNGSHTPIWSYLTHWGVFLFVIISWIIWETREWMAATPLSSLRKLTPYKGILIAGGIFSLLWMLALLFMGISIAWFVLPLVIWVCILIFRPGISDAKRAVLVMVAAGLSMTVMVEIIVLVGDIGRMNTVFKFYLQVWTLLAISAAAGFGWILMAFSKWVPGWRTLWQTTLVVLVASAALYPLLGGTAKIKDRMVEGVPLTLDGMAFMEYAEYDDLGTKMDLSQDYRAIRWLQDNVPGSPVIIEGNMVEYHWGTRNTIYTGLPNVIGWNWHQRQQRALAPEELIPDRLSDVSEFYLTTDLTRAKTIIDSYGVKYVIVGQLERALYPGPGLEKFNTLDGVLWKEVYRTEDTSIYQVNE